MPEKMKVKEAKRIVLETHPDAHMEYILESRTSERPGYWLFDNVLCMRSLTHSPSPKPDQQWIAAAERIKAQK